MMNAERDTHPKWVVPTGGRIAAYLEMTQAKKPSSKVSSLIILISAWTVRILVRKIVFSPHILTCGLLFASKTCNCKRNSVVR